MNQSETGLCSTQPERLTFSGRSDWWSFNKQCKQQNSSGGAKSSSLPCALIAASVSSLQTACSWIVLLNSHPPLSGEIKDVSGLLDTLASQIRHGGSASRQANYFFYTALLWSVATADVHLYLRTSMINWELNRQPSSLRAETDFTLSAAKHMSCKMVNQDKVENIPSCPPSNHFVHEVNCDLAAKL